jgi:hypothetical protein
MTPNRKWTLALTVPVLLFAAIQFVPYGRDHRNPPDGALAAFDSPRTQELAQRACNDCHSNRTRWPWYASIAPISWRVQSHVNEGRGALNLTALNTASKEGAEAAGEAGETVLKGEMPPWDYLLMHPEARLTAAEKAELARGLDVTFAAFIEGGEKGEGKGAGAATAPGARERGESGEKGEAGEKDEAGEKGERGGDKN